MEAESRGGPALLVFAEDWGRHASSCQRLVPHLLPRYDVWWINTIGMRRPCLDRASLRRGIEKLRHWLAPRALRATPPHLHVVSPLMWPWFTTWLDARLNKTLLRRQLTRLLNALPEPPVAITKIPLVADLMGVLPVRHWVYYCVDDFSQWPGLDQPALSRMEQEVIRRADRLIAVSEVLRERLARMGREAHLLTHGVDLDFWQGDASGSLPQLDGLQRPLVVFWGLIDRRMDVAFVQRLAEELAQGTIVLAGPEADPDPALFRSHNVARLGPVAFEQLPVLAREAAVLVMPYADLAVTRAMQPLKLKEYLATSKPVVVRDLPATRPWADGLDLVQAPDAFAQAVRQRIQSGLPDEQRHARLGLVKESWAEKARAFERWAILPAASDRGPAAVASEAAPRSSPSPAG